MSADAGWKQPVLLATTANITLSGEQTIDGVLTSEDRVLVKNQTDTAENGIYVSSSGAWERATDFDASPDFVTGTAVYITSGSTNSGKQYNCTVSAEPPVVGTSTVTWTAFTPSSSLGADLTAVEALTGTGIVRRTVNSPETWTTGTLVTNAESADMAQSTIKGRAAAAGTGVPTDLTATQATAILNVVAQDLKGLVPGPTAAEIAANKVLRADATWVAGAGDLLAANNLSDVAVAATAFANIKQAATDAASGVVELATDAEAITGTDTARAPAVSSMTAAIKARTEAFTIPVTDENAVVISGTNKITFRLPYAMTLTAVRGSLTTAQTSGAVVTVDVNEAGVSVISTKLTIDNGEKTSTTAAVPVVISDTALADDAEITIDVDAVGDGTARGLKVYLIGTRV
jgi:hypothetical protein